MCQVGTDVYGLGLLSFPNNPNPSNKAGSLFPSNKTGSGLIYKDGPTWTGRPGRAVGAVRHAALLWQCVDPT